MKTIYFAAAIITLNISTALAEDIKFNSVHVDSLKLNGVKNIDYSFSSKNPGNYIIASPGNSVSFCPLLSCVIHPNSDHQRTSFLVAAETQDDGHSEEQTLAVLTKIATGYAKDWA